jgi:hypothetical protein
MWSNSPAQPRARPTRPRDEVLEGVDGEEQPGAAAVAVDERVHLLVGRAAASRRWIARPSIAIAAEALSESIARTRSPPSSLAAARALSIVPESLPAMCTERIRS